MKIKYFQDIDTLYIELRAYNVGENRDFDKNTLIDMDEHGEIGAFIIEHASARVDLTKFSFERV